MGKLGKAIYTVGFWIKQSIASDLVSKAVTVIDWGGVFCDSSFSPPQSCSQLETNKKAMIIQATVIYACLRCVKPSMRPLSMAISTVSIHIYGDVPSSPLVGVLQDHINNQRLTTLTLTAVQFLDRNMDDRLMKTNLNTVKICPYKELSRLFLQKARI